MDAHSHGRSGLACARRCAVAGRRTRCGRRRRSGGRPRPATTTIPTPRACGARATPLHFFEDDPAQTLPNIGGWTSEQAAGDRPADLLDRLRTNRLEPGRLYMATIMIQRCNLDSDSTLQPAIAALLDRFAADVATGDLVWATLPTVLATWRGEYAQAPVVLRP